MPVKFIADIGANHNQDLGRCDLLIKTAKDIGCWGVKFQMYQAEKMYNLKDMPKDFHKTELKKSWIPDIRRICFNYGIFLGCSPFYIDAVKYLYDWDVDFLKIASYEITRPLLIKACAETGLPMMISTGLASMNEIFEAVEVCRSVKNDNIVLYHCCAEYPAPVDHCELININILKDSILNKHLVKDIGWSDHSHQVGVINKAIGNGANWIEFHFDLDDKKGGESKFGHCWSASEIKKVIEDIKIGELANKLAKSKPVELRKQRSDPIDGLRPYKEIRK